RYAPRGASRSCGRCRSQSGLGSIGLLAELVGGLAAPGADLLHVVDGAGLELGDGLGEVLAPHPVLDGGLGDGVGRGDVADHDDVVGEDEFGAHSEPSRLYVILVRRRSAVQAANPPATRGRMGKARREPAVTARKMRMATAQSRGRVERWRARFAP